MKSLLSISIICSVIGLIILALLANNLEPNLKEIKEIDEKSLEEIVKVQGRIVFIKKYESLTILTLDDGTGKIDSVYYKDLEIKEDILVEVIGKVVEYKGKIEIEINKIKILGT